MRAIRIHVKEDVRLEEQHEIEQRATINPLGRSLGRQDAADHKLRRGEGMKILISAEPA